MQKLVYASELTIKLLENSEDSLRTNQSAEEAKSILEKELEIYKQKQIFSFSGKNKIKFLFLPTGTLHEISLSNGWENEYLQISKIVDGHLS